MNTSALKKNRICIVLVLLSALVTALFFIKGCIGNSAGGQETQGYLVERMDIEEVVTALGQLEPREYVDVGAQVSGQLKKLHVSVGDTVQRADLLAEIDPRIHQARAEADAAKLKALTAQLVEQEAQVQLSRQIYNRNERLITTHAVSMEMLEISKAEKDAAEGRMMALRAQIIEAKSTLEASRTNLEYTKIYAPINGTIVLETAREGQTLNANQTTPIIFQLANLDIMTVRAQVAEADVMRLTPGMPAYFTTLSSHERRWEGTVRQILPSPEIINDVVLYLVLIDVDNTDRQLMTGMSAQVFFVTGSASNVPVIPVEALKSRAAEYDNDSGRAYTVTTPGKDGSKQDRIIHTGLMTRTHIEIRSGLKEGDTVFIPHGGLLSRARQTGRTNTPPPFMRGPRI